MENQNQPNLEDMLLGLSSETNVLRKLGKSNSIEEQSNLYKVAAQMVSGEDEENYYYLVELDSFSYFAIGEKVVEEEAETTTGTTTGEKSNKIMWIVIAILLLAVLAGGVVWKKRSER